MKSDNSQIIQKLKKAQEDDISALRNKHEEQMEGMYYLYRCIYIIWYSSKGNVNHKYSTCITYIYVLNTHCDVWNLWLGHQLLLHGFSTFFHASTNLSPFINVSRLNIVSN